MPFSSPACDVPSRPMNRALNGCHRAGANVLRGDASRKSGTGALPDARSWFTAPGAYFFAVRIGVR
jgi:hypothetical protein